MPQRIIRESLLYSDRFLDLPSNCERMAFLALLLRADDRGNLEATDGGLHRMWRDFEVDTVKDSLAILEHLTTAELVKVYEVDGKRFIHIPRFQQKLRSYKSQVPLPPWQENEIKQSDSKKSGRKLQKTLLEEEVEVEVEEEVEEEVNNNNIVKIIGSGDVVETLPMKNGTCRVCKSFVLEMEPCYPSVDIVKTIKQDMKGWLLANPAKRKTAKGMTKFLNTWFLNEQRSADDKFNKKEIKHGS